jgi:uncharacterized protein with ATP-grasp and redox domains
MIGEIYALLKKKTGNKDPYLSVRNKYNRIFLNGEDSFLQKIEMSENPFYSAVRYAIIGNIIDFNPIHNLCISDIKKYFNDFEKDELEIDHIEKLKQDIQNAGSVLYIGDNCGEICLDKIMLKKMKELNPACEFYFAVRGMPVVHDSIEEDAYTVGIDQYAHIISNGDGSLGTVLHRTSEAFQDIYRKADTVAAKGQANYECLSQERKNIYFLLMTKCGVIAADIGISQMKMICMKSRMK